MAAAIIQRYKARGGQLPLQPGKKDLALGEVGAEEAGFGAVATTGYLDLTDL